MVLKEGVKRAHEQLIPKEQGVIQVRNGWANCNKMNITNKQIAYWVTALGAVMFLFQIHQISGLEEEAAVWQSQVNAHNNPGADTYCRAFFDGFTFGAFSHGNIFAEGDKLRQEGKQLEDQGASIGSRYESAVSYRNWGLGIAIGGILYIWMVKKSPQINH